MFLRIMGQFRPIEPFEISKKTNKQLVIKLLYFYGLLYFQTLIAIIFFAGFPAV